MIEEYQQKREQQVARMRSVTHYVMGVLFFCLGVFFLVYEYFEVDLIGRKPSSLDKVIGVLFIAYGAWRIYRGYKKNYFRR
ncbi:MAG TPA: hypothetical protein VEZ55_12935 [Chitinophagaceae bacterium]|jgi:threonine/homoserine/homoserine lactone efflux protein|nr:hypothetical protein [Chitinophagaceae bacterium]